MTADCVADCAADCAADHPVGMAFLLGNWATVRWGIAGQSQNDRR